MSLHILGDVEIEARIVDENHAVGLPFGDVALAHPHIAQDGGQVEQYGYEAHIGQLAVVLHKCAANGRHQVAAEEAEPCLRVNIFQRPHQMRGMQVARGLTGYEVILHLLFADSLFTIHGITI